MARSKPEIIAVITTVLLHGIVAVVFALIIVDVHPMTSPPIEVELFGYDESAIPARDDGSDTETPESAPIPAIREEIPITKPLQRETTQPPPRLPQSRPIDDGVSIPPLFEQEKQMAMPRPSSRIKPIPIGTEHDSTAVSSVQVRLEGLLSTRRLIHMIRPAFPPDVPMDGEVKIHLEVASDGAVEMARVIQKAHPRFDDSALRAVRQWRFAPDAGSTTAEGDVTIYFRVK